MSSVSRDNKLTWFVVIFNIEKESSKSACKIKHENRQITIQRKVSLG